MENMVAFIVAMRLTMESGNICVNMPVIRMWSYVNGCTDYGPGVIL